MNKLSRVIPPVLLAFSLMLIYVKSMAPGLTWANQGADGGDLITAAATRGVAHPTGYPLYLLLARLFQQLPIGPLAFRTNLMSGCCTVFAAMLVYFLVNRSLSIVERNQSRLAGLVAGYAFGLSPLVWSQAVITEVYALHTVFVVLILIFSTAELGLLMTDKRSDQLTGLVFGLAMGNHLTIILLSPLLFSSILLRKSAQTDENPSITERSPALDSFLRRLLWLSMGLLVYLILPLRGYSHPPVNWGNPLTLNGFAWLVSGKLYQGQFLAMTLISVWLRIQSVAAMLTDQFGLPGLLMGFTGLVIFYRSNQLYRNTVWIVVASIFFAILYATEDSYLYLIPAFLCFAIWIGWGLGGLLGMISGAYRKIGMAGGFVLIFYLLVLAGSHWSQVDASGDLRAEKFGEQVFSEAPLNSIVFAKGDKAVFSLWYFHYALGRRLDLIVIATDLLHFDWYQDTLRNTYPSLKLPGPFPFAETIEVDNSDRPVCYVEYIQYTDIRCLSAKSP